MKEENIDWNVNKTYDAEEQLVRAWVGDKNQDLYIENFKKGGFNFSAFIIPDLLFLTRKMWIEAFIIIAIDLLIMWFNGGIPYPVALVIRAILGFAYYPLYNASIKRKIKKYEKQGLSYEQQLEKANKYGGDKITVAVLVAFIVAIALFVILAVRMFNLDFGSKKNNNNYYSSDFNITSTQEKIKEQEEQDAKLLEELKKQEEYYETKYNVTDDISGNIDTHTAYDNDSNNNKYKTKSTSGIIEDNDLKLSYDSTKWREVYVDDAIEAKAMLSDNNDNILGYLVFVENEGNLSDKEDLKEIMNTLKTSFQQEFYERYGQNINIESNARKNKKDIYLLSFKVEEYNTCYYIVCRQLEENKIQCASFALIATLEQEVDTKEIEKMLLKIEFKD